MDSEGAAEGMSDRVGSTDTEGEADGAGLSVGVTLGWSLIVG